MVVHSIVITNFSGVVVMSKFFVLEPNPTEFISKLLFHLKGYQSSEISQAVSIGKCVVVFELFGEFVVYLVGDQETEEEILAEMLAVLRKVCKDILEDRFTLASLLDPENAGKLDVALDEMLPQGIAESTDAETILRMAKMKSF